ncbi:UNVERIFIED_CONTAM: amidohydrolase, partial [Bifidobacterium animalis]|nr:amidohydrolase [Bifidobacterium animalis]
MTGINEFSVSGEMMAGIRALRADTPRLTLAVRLGVPHGHGTESQFTNAITIQVTNPAEAHAAMAAALVNQPDMVKVFADGGRYGDPERPDRPSIDEPTLAAIVEDAHRAGIKVMTHTVTLDGAKIAARAGVDSVAHGVGDTLVDDE